MFFTASLKLQFPILLAFCCLLYLTHYKLVHLIFHKPVSKLNQEIVEGGPRRQLLFQLAYKP